MDWDGVVVKDDLEIVSFKSADKWESWLKKNHAKSPGVWLRIAKVGSGKKSVTYDEALDGALCYGWIDGRREQFDSESWLLRFTPRRPKSIWSLRNVENVKRLIKAKRMRAAGLQQIQAAEKDGRWRAAEDSQREGSTSTT